MRRAGLRELESRRAWGLGPPENHQKPSKTNKNRSKTIKKRVKAFQNHAKTLSRPDVAQSASSSTVQAGYCGSQVNIIDLRRRNSSPLSCGKTSWLSRVARLIELVFI